MPKYRVEGEVYEANSPEEAYAKHDSAMAMRQGAQMSPVAQGALTVGSTAPGMPAASTRPDWRSGRSAIV